MCSQIREFEVPPPDYIMKAYGQSVSILLIVHWSYIQAYCIKLVIINVNTMRDYFSKLDLP